MIFAHFFSISESCFRMWSNLCIINSYFILMYKGKKEGPSRTLRLKKIITDTYTHTHVILKQKSCRFKIK